MHDLFLHNLKLALPCDLYLIWAIKIHDQFLDKHFVVFLSTERSKYWPSNDIQLRLKINIKHVKSRFYFACKGVTVTYHGIWYMTCHVLQGDMSIRMHVRTTLITVLIIIVLY